MKFFLDNTLSHKLANGLKDFGEEVCHLQDHFPPNAKDTEWLPWIGRERMFLITHDRDVRRHTHERAALMSAEVGAFVLSSRTAVGRCHVIQLMVRRWPEIKAAASKTTPPFVYRVPDRGKLERLA